jgi:hypothetical protein
MNKEDNHICASCGKSASLKCHDCGVDLCSSAKCAHNGISDDGMSFVPLCIACKVSRMPIDGIGAVTLDGVEMPMFTKKEKE